MFVPSLSWQTDRFLYINGAKMPFFAEEIDKQRRKIRAVEFFLRTLQSGGDLAAQLEAKLSSSSGGSGTGNSTSPRDAATGAGAAACEQCARNGAAGAAAGELTELEKERAARVEAEEKCDAQARRIAELEQALAAVEAGVAR
jgi:hypothetical protein